MIRINNKIKDINAVIMRKYHYLTQSRDKSIDSDLIPSIKIKTKSSLNNDLQEYGSIHMFD